MLNHARISGAYGVDKFSAVLSSPGTSMMTHVVASLANYGHARGAHVTYPMPRGMHSHNHIQQCIRQLTVPSHTAHRIHKISRQSAAASQPATRVRPPTNPTQPQASGTQRVPTNRHNTTTSHLTPMPARHPTNHNRKSSGNSQPHANRQTMYARQQTAPQPCAIRRPTTACHHTSHNREPTNNTATHQPPHRSRGSTASSRTHHPKPLFGQSKHNCSRRHIATASQPTPIQSDLACKRGSMPTVGDTCQMAMSGVRQLGIQQNMVTEGHRQRLIRHI